MKADDHFAKAERMAATQAKLDPATDWESIIEGCYMAAHNYVIAGVEYCGISHPQSHKHAANAQLLRQANAPDEVKAAWDALERLRNGNVYGGRTNGVAVRAPAITCEPLPCGRQRASHRRTHGGRRRNGRV